MISLAARLSESAPTIELSRVKGFSVLIKLFPEAALYAASAASAAFLLAAATAANRLALAADVDAALAARW